MCGGAVLSLNSLSGLDASLSGLQLRGMIEGIVQTGDADHPLEQNVSFIDSTTIATWINTLK